MKYVDEDTRRDFRDRRIQSLEADNFDETAGAQEDDDAYGEEDVSNTNDILIFVCHPLRSPYLLVYFISNKEHTMRVHIQIIYRMTLNLSTKRRKRSSTNPRLLSNPNGRNQILKIHRTSNFMIVVYKYKSYSLFFTILIRM